MSQLIDADARRGSFGWKSTRPRHIGQMEDARSIQSSRLTPLLCTRNSQHGGSVSDTPFESSNSTSVWQNRVSSSESAVSFWDPLGSSLRLDYQAVQAKIRRVEQATSTDGSKVSQQPGILHSKQSLQPPILRQSNTVQPSHIFRPSFKRTNPASFHTSFDQTSTIGYSSVSRYSNDEEQVLLRKHDIRSSVLSYYNDAFTDSTSTYLPSRTATSIEPDYTNKAQSRVLPSSLLLRSVSPYSSTITHSKMSTTDTSGSSHDLRRAPVIGNSTEDLISKIYLEAEAEAEAEEDEQPEQLAHLCTSARRKSVQWATTQKLAGGDTLDNILNSYFDQQGTDDEAHPTDNPAKLSMGQEEEDAGTGKKMSARDQEKAIARRVFRRKSDWQKEDNICEFLKKTKDLSGK